ncbi:MAG TPA: hypothetical protein DEQ80_08275 [Anaerolinea thermolimosa]|uniref:Polysaccharide biosynthesis protein C-terminal domain-containing protein n=1 Tax=Anaerolinea thermolimosa TaxID=229919 RepID=A0A3D1JGY9_9CHLR|nr:hypothetical protein [Anaerolinea thermolimosa]
MTASSAARFVQNKLIPALPALRRWVGRGFWAVLDQALFAGSNFLVGVLLARWLEPAAYGAFSTAYSVFMLVGTLHTGLWTEPMLVYGSGRFRESFRGYQRALIADHWRLLFLSTLAFTGVGGFFLLRGASELGLSFLGLGVATPLILYLWLVRRSAYVLIEPRLAAGGGALYMVLYLGCAGGLFRLGWLNEATAFLAMGGTALVAGGFIFSRVQKRLAGPATAEPSPGQVRRLHWEYGRWALLAGALSWVPGNIYYVLLPVFRSLEEVAVFKALSNLLMPVLHFNGALVGLFVPVFVRAINQKRVYPTLFLCGGILVLSALIYMGVLMVWGEPLMRLLYGEKFTGYGQALVLLSFWPLINAGSNTLMAYLRASERPQWIAVAYLFAALVALGAGSWLTLQYGLTGAIVSILLSMFSLLVIVFSISWKIR